MYICVALYLEGMLLGVSDDLSGFSVRPLTTAVFHYCTAYKELSIQTITLRLSFAVCFCNFVLSQGLLNSCCPPSPVAGALVCSLSAATCLSYNSGQHSVSAA